MNKAQWAAVYGAASRLALLVGSCPEGHDPLVPYTCPFCADEVAYINLVKAFPSVEKALPAEPTGVATPIDEIKKFRCAWCQYDAPFHDPRCRMKGSS